MWVYEIYSYASIEDIVTTSTDGVNPWTNRESAKSYPQPVEKLKETCRTV